MITQFGGSGQDEHVQSKVKPRQAKVYLLLLCIDKQSKQNYQTLLILYKYKYNNIIKIKESV